HDTIGRGGDGTAFEFTFRTLKGMAAQAEAQLSVMHIGRNLVDLRGRHKLVVGGGIAGMQSSLDLADMGIKVHLVEKLPSIGGKMAQLDKTFPTNDCAI
ncbi:MAG: NAD(P)-binding protein, partial [Candidatus Desulfacyla sp.]